MAITVLALVAVAGGAIWYLGPQGPAWTTAESDPTAATDTDRNAREPASRTVPKPKVTPSSRASASPTRTPARTARPEPKKSTTPKAQPTKAPERASPKPTARRSSQPTAKPAPSAPPSRQSQFEAEVVSLTNAARSDAGCDPLHTDSRLRQAARAHSADMAARGYFDHNSPDGTTPWDRMKDAGYTSPSGENIARGYQTPEAVVEGWLDSPGHRRNILNCESKAIGVGVYFGDGGPWWTQDFGYR